MTRPRQLNIYDELWQAEDRSSGKPSACPCCGHPGEVNWGRTYDETWAYVICKGCGLRTANQHGKSDRDTAQMAVAVWNRRTP